MSVNEAGDVTINNAQFTGSIQDFLDLTTNANLTNHSGYNFFMTNTPYTTAPGTGDFAPTGGVHLLASVDKEKIKETEAAAKNDPAAEIFVERAVAKVEVVANNMNNLSASNLPRIEDISWTIDNTEPTTYIARRLESNNPAQAPYWLSFTTVNTKPTFNYRFVGNTKFASNFDMYRVYFGTDPNGNGLALDENKLVVLQDNDVVNNTFKAVSAGETSNPQYCYENTFDVEHMDYHNTTRALLKVTYAGGDFYTRGIDRVTKYDFEAAAKTLAQFVLENSDAVAAWTEYFDEATTVTLTDLTCSSSTKTAKNNWVNIEYVIDANKQLQIKDLKLFNGNGQTADDAVPFLAGVNKQDVIDAINAQVTFNAYVGGVSYYAVRIKHFGDDLTPWIAPTTDGKIDGPLAATPTTAESYGTGLAATKDYLGRYGVLRNNWYQLNITSISKFGEPNIKDLPLDGTPDDNNDPDKAISCKINILSWAKRNQNVDL